MCIRDRVRVDGLADIDRITTHFNGQTDFADHVASVRADNRPADHPMRFGIENQLGEAVIGTVGDSTTGCRPRELGSFDLAAILLRLIFGDCLLYTSRCV